MSRNRGIGYGAIQHVGKDLLSQNINPNSEVMSDVPHGVRIDARIRPLGRYLTGKLRLATAHDSDVEPERSRQVRLVSAQAEAQSVGTVRYLRNDASRRRNDTLSADFALKLKESKEKL